MIEVTLSLTNEAKSDFSDVIGQDVKEKELRVEVDVHLLWERLSYTKGKIWNRGRLGERCEEYRISLGGPGKD